MPRDCRLIGNRGSALQEGWTATILVERGIFYTDIAVGRLSDTPSVESRECREKSCGILPARPADISLTSYLNVGKWQRMIISTALWNALRFFVSGFHGNFSFPLPLTFPSFLLPSHRLDVLRNRYKRVLRGPLCLRVILDNFCFEKPTPVL